MKQHQSGSRNSQSLSLTPSGASSRCSTPVTSSSSRATTPSSSASRHHPAPARRLLTPLPVSLPSLTEADETEDSHSVAPSEKLDVQPKIERKRTRRGSDVSIIELSDSDSEPTLSSTQKAYRSSSSKGKKKARTDGRFSITALTTCSKLVRLTAPPSCWTVPDPSLPDGDFAFLLDLTNHPFPWPEGTSIASIIKSEVRFILAIFPNQLR